MSRNHDRDITNLPPVMPLPTRQATSDERRAEALAEVQQMNTDLLHAREDIKNLTTELARVEDRLSMALEDRNKYRAEALSVRAKLIELATSMATISLQCRAAEGIVVSVHELTNGNGETPSDAALDALEMQLNIRDAQ
jgi:chromosome segregation ATPase